MMNSTRSLGATLACWLIIGHSTRLLGFRAAPLAGQWTSFQRRQPVIPALGTVNLVYFSEPTGPACQAASPAITLLQRRYPGYRLARVDTATAARMALQQEYYRAYHVPPRDQNRIPILFAGHRYFLGTGAIQKTLPAFLAAGPLPARPGHPWRSASVR